MYIRDIKLTNVRRFKRLAVHLGSPDADPQRFVLFLGDNGTGKTSLLRALALSLCDETSAAGLVRELPGNVIRYGTRSSAKIQITLASDENVEWTITTKIIPDRGRSSKDRLEFVTQTIMKVGARARKPVQEHKFPWKRLFVVAYGAGRNAEGTQEYYRYRQVDAVYTLFRYDQPLQSAELALRRLRHAAGEDSIKRRRKGAINAITDKFLSLLSDILMLERGSAIEPPRFRLTPTGVFYETKHFKVPLIAQSDGYRSTLTWLTDLLASYLLYDPAWSLDPKDMQGIVLLDELEQHLHPGWQRSIVPLLSRHFPNLQFIVTTHSPLVVLGTTALAPEVAELVVLQENEDVVEKQLQTDPPLHQRADQLLTSQYFGLFSASGYDVGAQIQEYAALRSKKRLSKEAKRRMRSLYTQLNRTFGPGDDELQREIEHMVRRAFAKKTASRLREIDPKAVTFETRRQIKQIVAGQRD